MDNFLMDNLMALPVDYPSFVQQLEMPELTAQDLHVDVLRLDKLHPVVSGNKWFKLKGHLRLALLSPDDPVLTFGGAWSNHLVATAFAAKQLGLQAIGIIRGERPSGLSATLRDALSYGMRLEFITREEYACKEQSNFLQRLTETYPGAYIIPEGGGGEAGILGSEDILRGLDTTGYTHILCAIGTGTTFLGLVRAATPGQLVIGVPVLKGFDMGVTAGRSMLFPDYHFGGYARHPQQLLDFMNRFYRETGIPSDIVYTGKLFYALCDSIGRHFFPARSRLLVIHSGGLQGNQSLSPALLEF
jgi:1-aminocyclopropane-1-carboxylate deaminase/D-cysteine desulfhydrase-like pyridoxal-dependent ACC family enzyme